MVASDNRKRSFLTVEKIAPLLSKLLPILLPPARAVFGEVLQLPYALYSYQKDGVEWLVDHKPGVLLADDMGLGKTVQAIVALRHLFRSGQALSALIVSPRSVMTTWRRHFEEWAPELGFITIDGPAFDRQMWWEALRTGGGHVGLVTYDALRNDLELAMRHQFSVVVFDEVQYCKNPSSQRYRAANQLNSARKWGLTGTPLENSVGEFATILGLIDPGLGLTERSGLRSVKNAARKVMLRRKKEEVLSDLPELTQTIVYVDLTAKQREAYEDAEKRGIARLRRQERSITNVLALITALKQICNGVDRSSSKTEWLDEYLAAAVESNDKVLIFSQYVTALKQLSLDFSKFSTQLFTGSLSQKQRDNVIDEFQNVNSVDALLISLRAGGVGLTLTAANRVVHFDSWWNPAVQTQATARVHRIGQTKTVFETTLVSVNTIEERIQKTLDDKRDLFAMAVDDLSTQGLSRVLTGEELYGLFGLEVQTPTTDDVPEPAATEIEVTRSSTIPISASTSFSNVVTIRRILREAKGILWWVDPHFSRRALEEVALEISDSAVSEIRIISRDISAKDHRDYKRFVDEMIVREVATEWRLFRDQRLFHDRFIAFDERTVNVPPVNLIYDRNAPYSEINESDIRPPLEDWWSKSEAVIIN